MTTAKPRGLRIGGKGAIVHNAPGWPEIVTFAPGEMMPGDLRQEIDRGLREGRVTVTFGKEAPR